MFGPVARRLLCVLAISSMLGGAVWAQSSSAPPPPPCDLNKDGKVDEREQQECKPPPPAPCDFDGDGSVTAAEKERCAKPTTHSASPSPPAKCDFNQDGMIDDQERAKCDGIRDACDADGDGAISESEKSGCQPPPPAFPPCDFNKDGKVEDAERAKCHEQAASRCDTDKDGIVSEEEKRACIESGQACDFNNDGQIDAHEKQKCDGGPGTHCRAALEGLEKTRNDFYASFKQKVHDFEAGLQTRIDEFSKGNHTEEEWATFRKDMDALRHQFHEEMEQLRKRFEAESEKPEACQGEGFASGGGCTVDDAQADRFAGYMDQQKLRGDEERQAMILKFKNYQEEQRRAFEGKNASEEEKQAFHEQQARERQQFEQDLQASEARWRDQLEQQWREFKENQARACISDQKREGFHEYQSDVRDQGLECRLLAQGEFDAFFTTHGSTIDNWTEATKTDYMNLKKKAMQLVHECEKKVHDEWKKEVASKFKEERKEERFGEFVIDDDGSGSGSLKGRFVSFDYDSGSLALSNYRVQGLLLFERFYAPHDIDEPHVEGATLSGKGVLESELGDVKLHLKIHDNPTGGFHADCDVERARKDENATAGDPRSCTLSLPEGATIEKTGEGDGEDKSAVRYVVKSSEEEAFLLVLGPHFLEGTELEFTKAIRLFFPSTNVVHDDFANKDRERIRLGIAAGKILAEVDIVKKGDGAEFESYGYDLGEDGSAEGVEVESLPTGIAIDFDAESSAGKTVVFNIDTSLFGNVDAATLVAANLKIVYYDVAEDGSKVEVEIQQADSLQDILDPGETVPEYWIVLDANGLQAMVSTPHFSAKRVEITAQSIEALKDGIPGPGGVLAIGALLAGLVLAPRRRRKGPAAA